MEGIVKTNMVTLKRGGYLHKGQKVTSNDVNNFSELVKSGKIEIKSAKKDKAPAKKDDKK